MAINRRYFIKSFGVTLGSLITSNLLSGCNKDAEQNVSTAKMKLISRDSELEPLRQCWLDLNNLQQTIIGAYQKEREEERDSGVDIMESVKEERAAKHQAILNTIVEADKLDKLVAEQIQVAFEEAQFHTARSMATCYIIIPYEANVRGDLLHQAEILGEISDGLDPKIVSKAQKAIAQDMAYFETILDSEDNYNLLKKNYEAGKLKASPEALEAARFLTELLLPETSG